jgi:hypothetical protein
MPRRALREGQSTRSEFWCSEATPGRGATWRQTPGLAMTPPNCDHLATKPNMTGRDHCPIRTSYMAVGQEKRGRQGIRKTDRNGQYKTTDLAVGDSKLRPLGRHSPYVCDSMRSRDLCSTCWAYGDGRRYVKLLRRGDRWSSTDERTRKLSRVFIAAVGWLSTPLARRSVISADGELPIALPVGSGGSSPDTRN